MCSCRFSVSMRGGEFRRLLCCHLGPESWKFKPICLMLCVFFSSNMIVFWQVSPVWEFMSSCFGKFPRINFTVDFLPFMFPVLCFQSYQGSDVGSILKLSDHFTAILHLIGFFVFYSTFRTIASTFSSSSSIELFFSATTFQIYKSFYLLNVSFCRILCCFMQSLLLFLSGFPWIFKSSLEVCEGNLSAVCFSVGSSGWATLTGNPLMSVSSNPHKYVFQISGWKA